MKKIYKNIMSMLILPFFLMGCWDYKDLNERSNVLSVGVDKVKDNIEFVNELANINKKQEGENENIVESKVYKSIVYGTKFEGARADFNANVPLRDFLGANRVIVFSKKYAEDGIRSYINRIYNIQEFRSSALVVISREPTKELFSGIVKNDICIGYGVENTVKYLSDIGLTLYKTIQNVNSDMHVEGTGDLIPYITKNGDTVEYLGFAVMKDCKLVGIVDKKNSEGYLFILSKKAKDTMLVQHPSNKQNLLSIKSDLKKRKIKVNYENNHINIYIDLNLTSQLAYPYKLEPISKEDFNKIEDDISEKIKKSVIDATESSKKEFKCDVFGFKKYFKAQNASTYKSIDWEKEYLNANFHVNVKTKIMNTNLIDMDKNK